VTPTDHIRHRHRSARLVDAIADAYDLEIVEQAGDKRTLYATPDDRTILVAELAIWPRTLTPLTVRAPYDGAVRDLRRLGWSG